MYALRADTDEEWQENATRAKIAGTRCTNGTASTVCIDAGRAERRDAMENGSGDV